MTPALTRTLVAALVSSAAITGQSLSPPTIYFGMCDASAAVALGHDTFAVANDEDNVIRVYQRQPPALPVSSFDLSSFLGPSREARPHWLTPSTSPGPTPKALPLTRRRALGICLF